MTLICQLMPSSGEGVISQKCFPAFFDKNINDSAERPISFFGLFPPPLGTYNPSKLFVRTFADLHGRFTCLRLPCPPSYTPMPKQPARGTRCQGRRRNPLTYHANLLSTPTRAATTGGGAGGGRHPIHYPRMILLPIFD